LGRAQSNRALLDHYRRAGPGRPCNTEGPLMGQVRCNLVVGLGKTGVSAVRWLRSRGEKVMVTDSRVDPPGLASLGEMIESSSVRVGCFDVDLLRLADRVVVSPGVSLAEPIVQSALQR
jgi:UDP-N-acetylmuramoylalanine--D-glutamate ligase